MLQHRELPSKYSYDKLSFVFGISREAVARIVKSKWTREASLSFDSNKPYLHAVGGSFR
jgi:hypothetical protein